MPNDAFTRVAVAEDICRRWLLLTLTAPCSEPQFQAAGLGDGVHLKCLAGSICRN